MKCETCSRAATVHITEVLPEDDFAEHHFCEECYRDYLTDASSTGGGSLAGSWPNVDLDEESVSEVLSQQCPTCKIQFLEFRNTGRLGCPHDYDVFAQELIPLLENIHGDTRHKGKVPRHSPSPQPQKDQSELIELREKLEQAVEEEAYEKAAELRDRIRQLEEGS